MPTCLVSTNAVYPFSVVFFFIDILQTDFTNFSRSSVFKQFLFVDSVFGSVRTIISRLSASFDRTSKICVSNSIV